MNILFIIIYTILGGLLLFILGGLYMLMNISKMIDDTSTEPYNRVTIIDQNNERPDNV
jgi:hypothetical protein